MGFASVKRWANSAGGNQRGRRSTPRTCDNAGPDAKGRINADLCVGLLFGKVTSGLTHVRRGILGVEHKYEQTNPMLSLRQKREPGNAEGARTSHDPHGPSVRFGIGERKWIAVDGDRQNPLACRVAHELGAINGLHTDMADCFGVSAGRQYHLDANNVPRHPTNHD